MAVMAATAATASQLSSCVDKVLSNWATPCIFLHYFYAGENVRQGLAVSPLHLTFFQLISNPMSSNLQHICSAACRNDILKSARVCLAHILIPDKPG
jgi:hypothetical protein